jgi:hypothetical protein
MSNLREVTESDLTTHDELQQQIDQAAALLAAASVAVEKATWEKKRRCEEYRAWLEAAENAHRTRVKSDQCRILEEMTGIKHGSLI